MEMMAGDDGIPGYSPAGCRLSAAAWTESLASLQLAESFIKTSRATADFEPMRSIQLLRLGIVDELCGGDKLPSLGLASGANLVELACRCYNQIAQDCHRPLPLDVRARDEAASASLHLDNAITQTLSYFINHSATRGQLTEFEQPKDMDPVEAAGCELVMTMIGWAVFKQEYIAETKQLRRIKQLRRPIRPEDAADLHCCIEAALKLHAVLSGVAATEPSFAEAGHRFQLGFLVKQNPDDGQKSRITYQNTIRNEAQRDGRQLPRDDQG